MKTLIPCLTGLAIVFGFALKESAVEAVPTNDFLNSIGANSAIAARGETLEKTIEIVKYTGIRWIRSGYEGDVKMADYLKLHKETGIKFSYGLMSGGTDIPRLLKDGEKLAAAGALLAFEGSNEPNNWSLTYKGEKGGRDGSWLAVANLQKDFYRGVKANSKLKGYPVWSLCENGAQTDNMGLQFLTIPKAAGTLMPAGTKYADYATCHNYFSHGSNPGLYDNQTWNAADPGPMCKVDGLYGNYGLTWGKKFKGYTEQELQRLPRVTTETGVTIGGAFTEEKQARMYMTMYLAQFKRGWSHTALYLLRDRSDEAGNQSFGLYGPDYTPRRSAVYMHSMTTILADHGTSKQKKSLAYTLTGATETVHDLLLLNSNGKFQLVIWGEKVSGIDVIKLNLGVRSALVNVYDPIRSTSSVMKLRDCNQLSLEVRDHPYIVEID
ncbi:MAG: glycosyl hydrolase [Bacteroidota bacterium]